MVIPISIEPKQFLKAYLLCLNPMLHLKPREIEVLEAMLKVYFNLYEASKSGQIRKDEIDSRINDSMGRKVIRDLIHMSEASYNNHYKQLKRKKIITEDNKIQHILKTLDFVNPVITYKITKSSVASVGIVNKIDTKVLDQSKTNKIPELTKVGKIRKDKKTKSIGLNKIINDTEQ